jgi:ribonuclease VapC
MVIDASALVAILKLEPERELFSRLIYRASVRRISPVNWFEAAVQAERAGAESVAAFRDYIAAAEIVVTPVDQTQMRMAHLAWRDFGKGRHPARLNMGDCFAYALAKQSGEPLLFKGGDFDKTDIVAAV